MDILLEEPESHACAVCLLAHATQKCLNCPHYAHPECQRWWSHCQFCLYFEFINSVSEEEKPDE